MRSSVTEVVRQMHIGTAAEGALIATHRTDGPALDILRMNAFSSSIFEVPGILQVKSVLQSIPSLQILEMGHGSGFQ